MSFLLSTFTEIAQVDSRTRTGTIAIPLTTEIPNRVFTVKDTYGASENSTITLVTQGSDLFENGLNTMIVSNNFGSVTLYSGITNRWSIISGTILTAMNVSSLTASTIFIQPGYNSAQKWSLEASATTGAFALKNISSVTNVFTVDISSITRFNGPLMASTATFSSINLYDRGSLQMKNLQLSSAFLLINGENISSIGGSGGSGGSGITSENIVSTVAGLGTATYVSSPSLLSTVAGLGTATYISSPSLLSTVAGLGTATYISSPSLLSTVAGLGTATYISSPSLLSTVAGLGTATYVSTGSMVSTVRGLGSIGFISSSVAGINSSGNVGINSASNTSNALLVTGTQSNTNTMFLGSNLGVNGTSIYTGFSLDVNGPSQSAVYYSTMTTGGTLTITPANFGVFYNITTSGTYTIALAATQPSSNIGKYNVFRNNTTGALSIAITGGTGITSPVTCISQQSITFLVATTNSYALF
jgi:hypothetical protein